MTRHRESLFRFVYRYAQNEADAAELTEETFYRVYTHAARFRPQAKVFTWIFSIAANLCRDRLRKNKKRSRDQSIQSPLDGVEVSSLEDTVPTTEPNPSLSAVSQETLALIQSAIHELPHKLKVPFVYCVLEDNSYDDCASILATNRKTIETRIYRARKLLRRELENLVDSKI
jgi:RNA polymerase sigma-70 factor (ECF subfamily)